MARKVSESTVRRLSLYLRVLEEMDGRSGDGVPTVSSEDLAGRADTTAAQVRKDLSLFGSFGKRGLGYSVPELAGELREILGLDRIWRVALVGAGRLGSALFEYAGFRRRGFDVVAVLDADPEKIGRCWDGVEIQDVDTLESVVEAEEVDLVVLAVPARAGQEVVDRVVAAGVRGILNFAPARLRVPEGVVLNDVNLVMEMEAVSFSLGGRGRSG